MDKPNKELTYREFVPGDEFLLAALIKEVFSQFLEPDFCPDDSAVFLKSQEPKLIYFRFLFGNIFTIIAQDQNLEESLLEQSVAGFIEVKDYRHISFLFVRKESQKRGIGKQLLARAIKKCREVNPDLTDITLNSSNYARPIYEKLGFKRTTQPLRGLTKNSTPMILKL